MSSELQATNAEEQHVYRLKYQWGKHLGFQAGAGKMMGKGHS